MNSQLNSRIDSIDLLKGLVMVLMALDHTRDFFHQTSSLLDLTNPEHATWSIYFTRLITHFCAPAFSFLAGISAFIAGRKKTKSELSVFLLKRGVWLIFIEVTIITFAWYFDIQFRNVDLAVISCLGFSMIFLAALIHLPLSAILAISCIIIFGHNLLDNVASDGNFWWSFLYQKASHKLSDSLTLNIWYPIIPWIGVMSLGYYFGQYYDRSVNPYNRKKLFNLIGITALIVFVLMRWINMYGDPYQWKTYAVFSTSVFSFLNLTKYPASLLYLLITLSGAFLFLANSEKWRGRVVDFFTVFGRVPFFYYILHLYLIHGLALLLAGLTGHGWELMIQTTNEFVLGDFGFPLWIVYFVWIVIVLILYPFCRFFDSYKQGNKNKWWLSYL